MRLSANSLRPERRSTDGRMILKVTRADQKQPLTWSYASPLRNRIVDLLLTMNIRRVQLPQVMAAGQAKRERTLASASLRHALARSICRSICHSFSISETADCGGLQPRSQHPQFLRDYVTELSRMAAIGRIANELDEARQASGAAQDQAGPLAAPDTGRPATADSGPGTAHQDPRRARRQIAGCVHAAPCLSRQRLARTTNCSLASLAP